MFLFLCLFFSSSLFFFPFFCVVVCCDFAFGLPHRSRFRFGLPVLFPFLIIDQVSTLGLRPPFFLFCIFAMEQENRCFLCTGCGKSYSSDAALKQHKRRYCKPAADANCVTCGRSFSSFAGVSLHRRRAHPAEYQADLEREDRRSRTTFSDLEIHEIILEERRSGNIQFINQHLAQRFSSNPNVIRNLRRSQRYKSLWIEFENRYRDQLAVLPADQRGALPCPRSLPSPGDRSPVAPAFGSSASALSPVVVVSSDDDHDNVFLGAVAPSSFVMGTPAGPVGSSPSSSPLRLLPRLRVPLSLLPVLPPRVVRLLSWMLFPTRLICLCRRTRCTIMFESCWGMGMFLNLSVSWLGERWLIMAPRVATSSRWCVPCWVASLLARPGALAGLMVAFAPRCRLAFVVHTIISVFKNYTRRTVRTWLRVCWTV